MYKLNLLKIVIFIIIIILFVGFGWKKIQVVKMNDVSCVEMIYKFLNF